jgi:hypothetical protein
VDGATNPVTVSSNVGWQAASPVEHVPSVWLTGWMAAVIGASEPASGTT